MRKVAPPSPTRRRIRIAVVRPLGELGENERAAFEMALYEFYRTFFGAMRAAKGDLVLTEDGDQFYLCIEPCSEITGTRGQ